VNVGDVANTLRPVPVLSDNIDKRFAEEGVAKNVATPVPNPLTPVLIGNPVQFDNTPEVGVPKSGVTSVGLVANTSAPDPVSLVTAAAKFAEVGVAKNVATPDAKPLTPVAIGRPVQLVSVPDAGVPNVGVVRTGLVNVLLVSVSVPVKVTSVPDAGTVIVVVPDAAMVTSNAPETASEDPAVPAFKMLLPLLSKPFFATNLFVVAIFYPLGKLLLDIYKCGHYFECSVIISRCCT